eukprot:gene1932-3748_t
MTLPSNDKSWGHFQLLTEFPPFSMKDPREYGMKEVFRGIHSRPGAAFGARCNRTQPLPTNSWSQNMLICNDDANESNRILVIPYLVDTIGPIIGLRTYPIFIKGHERSVIVDIEADSGITLGAKEILDNKYVISDDGNVLFPSLAIDIEWKANITVQQYSSTNSIPIPLMRALLVRGSPYMSMEYISTTPLLHASQYMIYMIIDQHIRINSRHENIIFPVINEIEILFLNTDHTWLIFLSQPMLFTFVNIGGKWPEKDSFQLTSTQVIKHGMIRIALSNNCTTGRNAIHCENTYVHKPNSKKTVAVFSQLLRNHSDVYPNKSRIAITLAQGVLAFDWRPGLMSTLASPSSRFMSTSTTTISTTIATALTTALTKSALLSLQLPQTELLMLALPHHQEQLLYLPESKPALLDFGCVSTLQGPACPVIGNIWYLQEMLPEVNYSVSRPIRKELLPIIHKTIQKDLNFEIPINYRKGAGDTYFSGKMLAKLARILLIGEELGYDSSTSDIFSNALSNLRHGVEIWLNGSAKSPFLYDSSWGGLITCGCNYNGVSASCDNEFPLCPALIDPGQNYGNAYYNDHHFHYGYHIYAAAILVKFDHKWGRKFHERILFLIRDIANPSKDDPFFPQWRHKDWYIGSSWANGIVCRDGRPNPNGRNEESSAEAIAAYEAVALYGLSAAGMFENSSNSNDKILYESARLIILTGKLLLGSEIRSVQQYWHVRSRGKDVRRVYPDIYEPHVVGMLWTMLAEHQTWFGNEAWKSYGIQLLTITPASELRDNIEWIREMLPYFNASCAMDPVCEREGWSILVNAARASLCDWEGAYEAIMSLPDDVFYSAGGDGQSRSNCLWWIATRDCPS